MNRPLAAKSLILTFGTLAMLFGASIPTNAQSVCVGPLCGAPISIDEDVPNNTVADIYTFTGDVGSAFTAQVDTVAAGTAFDPWMRICTDVDVDTTRRTVILAGTCLSADDTFICTFPPPAYRCPRIVGSLPADLDGIYFVGVAAHPCCGGSFAGTVGEYRLDLAVSSAVPAAALLVDDRMGNLP